MRFVILGLGSIGKRHFRNLSRLTSVPIATVDSDPMVGADMAVEEYEPHRDDVVYICTPTMNHLSALNDLSRYVEAIFCEKPLIESSQDLQYLITIPSTPIAVGYCYRFYSEFEALKQSDPYHLSLAGVDGLISRYGETALDTMLSHSIDLALWLFGECESSCVVDRGFWASATLECERGSANLYANMKQSPRYSQGIALVEGGYRPVNINNTEELNKMYMKEMIAWLNFLDTGKEGELCMYDQAVRVQEIMSQNE